MWCYVMQIGKLKLTGSKMKFYYFICAARWKSISVKCSLSFYFRKIGSYKSEILPARFFGFVILKKPVLPMLGKLFECVYAKSLQSCPTLCDPMDCSPPGSSVLGILQARILEWAAMPSSRGSSRPGDQTCFSHLGRLVHYHERHLGSPGEAL